MANLGSTPSRPIPRALLSAEREREMKMSNKHVIEVKVVLEILLPDSTSQSEVKKVVNEQLKDAGLSVSGPRGSCSFEIVSHKITPTGPMGYGNPFQKLGVHAPFAILGTDPDKKGGGVQFWAYSEAEAHEALSAYRDAGYHSLSIQRCTEEGYLPY